MTKEIISAFVYLQKNESAMNDRQISFVKSMQKYFRTEKQLSDKQQVVLYEITRAVARTVAETGRI